MQFRPDSDARGTWTLHEPAANTAAVVTLAAVEDEHHVIDEILFSFNATPVSSITIAEDGTDVIVLDLVLEGAGHIPLRRPYISAKNVAVVITIAAPGADSTAKLAVHSR